MILIKLLIVITINLAIQANYNCENLATLIYEDLTCEPRLGPDGCASSYDCSHRKPKEGYCLFKGVYYKNNESVNGTAKCTLCFCYVESEKKWSSLVCDVESCVYTTEYRPQCYDTIQHDSCCYEEECRPFNDLATCENDGKTFREGVRFFPKDSCVSCICGKGYKGVYEKPFCTRIQCDVETRYSKEIEANCAPVYRKNDIKCCPTMFICPEQSVVENLERGEDSTVKCKFGSREFNVKDKFILKYNGSENASCSCTIPPLLTCELTL